MITMKEIINKVVKGIDLTREEASQAMDLLLTGEATQNQAAAFLTALRIKGETLDEIVGCAKTMQKKALHVVPETTNDYVDMVGTGGDGTNTFNISTTSVFVAAAGGVKICKHGNRAMSSKCGSTDVLEALGINVMLDDKGVAKCVDETGMGFMFAQVFISAMKYVGPVRREIGIRTIFNLLGPLSNPSYAKKQVIGIFSKDLTETYARAMQEMGVERALVFSGEDNMDEITTTGKTYISEIKGGKIINYTIEPKDFGISIASPEELKGGTPEENAKLTSAILKGEETGAKSDIVCMNAGAALYVGGNAETLAEGVKKAQEIVKSGKAYEKLCQVAEFSKSLA